MRYILIIILLFSLSIFYSCSSVPQIQLPPTNTNYATKGYVDTSVKSAIYWLVLDINYLKTQGIQDKKTIDSLKNVITINTIKVDTTSGSDFNIKNGIMTFNKPNLNAIIKAEVVRQLPIPNKIIAKKKKKN